MKQTNHGKHIAGKTVLLRELCLALTLVALVSNYYHEKLEHKFNEIIKTTLEQENMARLQKVSSALKRAPV